MSNLSSQEPDLRIGKTRKMASSKKQSKSTKDKAKDKKTKKHKKADSESDLRNVKGQGASKIAISPDSITLPFDTLEESKKPSSSGKKGNHKKHPATQKQSQPQLPSASALADDDKEKALARQFEHAGKHTGQDKILERFKAKYPYLQNRELSWLEFNKRVLDQGSDSTVPLFERLSFISIFWSNLQEFFMVRVGSLRDLALLKKEIIDSKSGMTPFQQLSAIYERCHELYPYYEFCYTGVRDLLAQEGFVNKQPRELTPEQIAFIERYYAVNVMPFLSPQIVNALHPFPHLANGELYVVVRLDEELEAPRADKGKASKKKKGEFQGAEGVTLGIIPLPKQCSRIIRLPGDGVQVVLLEHVIEMFVPQIFSMYKVKHTNVVCVTRNADLDVQEGAEEQGEDYREHMKRILKRRARLAPVRLESERELSETVKRLLLDRLNLTEQQTFVTSVPLDMSYVYDLMDYMTPEQKKRLTSKPHTPQWPSSLNPNVSIMRQVEEKEVLLSYPYESMDPFVSLLREAAHDDSVVSIKITLYRLARQSHLAEALIAAAESGKEVTALFELRARFDESNNIEWSQRFEQAGCNVIYGFRDYKVHSKICCITRQTDDGIQYITQIGTGNYNEKTAKLYTDFSFLTTDAQIGSDANDFFRNMSLETLSDQYKVLWVAPLQVKQNIIAKIDEQIQRHQQGLPSGLLFKTNSITDKEVIDKIVEASKAGVSCTLFVRGISCIVPGVEGFTENVNVFSIVGRFLEHSRIYCFGDFKDDVEIYLSSADLMTRNMDKRIEIAWPIDNEELKQQVIGYIATCMSDTAKLRYLLPNKQYTPLGYYGTFDESIGDVRLFDAQEYLAAVASGEVMEQVEEEVSYFADDIDEVRQVEESMAYPSQGQVEPAISSNVAPDSDVVQVFLGDDEDAGSQPDLSEPYVALYDASAPEAVSSEQVDLNQDQQAEDVPSYGTGYGTGVSGFGMRPTSGVELNQPSSVELTELPQTLPTGLPYIEGADRFDVVSPTSEVDESVEVQQWDIPNFASGEPLTLSVAKQEDDAQADQQEAGQVDYQAYDGIQQPVSQQPDMYSQIYPQSAYAPMQAQYPVQADGQMQYQAQADGLAQYQPHSDGQMQYQAPASLIGDLNSQYTDPNTSPEHYDVPPEKKGLFGRLFKKR